MLYRSSLEYINEWFNKKDNRKPLLIRGARQVGKTTIVRMLAEETGSKLVELNLEKSWKFTSVFKKLDASKVIQAIEFELNIDIIPDKTIIFFDEVQAEPGILPLLRYFYEETPEYRIVATGSLLEFVLAEPDFSIPVGRIELFYLGPLTFNEYLLALKEEKALDQIQNFNPLKNTDNYIHDKLTQLFRSYILTGGMPEAVDCFVNTSNLKEVEKIKSAIIDTFRLDFNKYHSKADPRLLTVVFDRLPQLAGKKIIYSHINNNYRSNELSKAIASLNMARIIGKVYNTSGNGVPLAAEKNERFYKIILLDTGLMLTQLKVLPTEIEMAEELNLINNGTIAEQVIGQELASLHPFYSEAELYYWAREKKASSAEIDYLITDSQNRIIPIEVKAGSTGSLRSLHMIVFEKSLSLAVRFNSDPATIFREKRKTVKGSIEFTLISLPHYMAGQLKRILKDY